MESNNIIRTSSTIITAIIFIAGVGLCYWLYTTVISTPDSTEETVTTTKIEINKDKLTKIQNPTRKERKPYEENYGRTNPFVPYKDEEQQE